MYEYKIVLYNYYLAQQRGGGRARSLIIVVVVVVVVVVAFPWRRYVHSSRTQRNRHCRLRWRSYDNSENRYNSNRLHHHHHHSNSNNTTGTIDGHRGGRVAWLSLRTVRIRLTVRAGAFRCCCRPAARRVAVAAPGPSIARAGFSEIRSTLPASAAPDFGLLLLLFIFFPHRCVVVPLPPRPRRRCLLSATPYRQCMARARSTVTLFTLIASAVHALVRQQQLFVVVVVSVAVVATRCVRLRRDNI